MTTNKNIEEVYYCFKPKKELGFVTISRHKHPDFIAMECLQRFGEITLEKQEEIIKENWIRKEILL